MIIIIILINTNDIVYGDGAGMAEWLSHWVSVSDLNAEGPGSNPGGGKEI